MECLNVQINERMLDGVQKRQIDDQQASLITGKSGFDSTRICKRNVAQLYVGPGVGSVRQTREHCSITIQLQNQDVFVESACQGLKKSKCSVVLYPMDSPQSHRSTKSNFPCELRSRQSWIQNGHAGTQISGPFQVGSTRLSRQTNVGLKNLNSDHFKL